MLKKNKRRARTLKIKRSPLMAIIFAAGFSSGYLYYEQNLPAVFSSTTQSPKMTVCFSPEGRCEKLAIHTIQSAKKEILVQAYSFTSRPITDALIEAKKNGIMVKVLFDRSQLQAPYSQIHRLKKAGVYLKVDSVKGIAHNKTIIVDGVKLITGSYNWSKAANSRNSENMLLINDQDLARIYKDNWKRRSNF